ncbi:MAG: hypothetical protein JXA10_04580, partial [Anaerolineae bacterium]|nr:hypothetical protein [Anaerolineae bacterium]
MINLHPAQGPRLIYQLSVRDQGRANPFIEIHAVGAPGIMASARLGRGDVPFPALADVWEMARQPVFHAELGQRLFRALFTGPAQRLHDRYEVARHNAATANVILTLELRFDR